MAVPLLSRAAVPRTVASPSMAKIHTLNNHNNPTVRPKAAVTTNNHLR